MKKITFALLLFLSICIKPVFADEGMWLPIFIERLNYVDMQKQGLHLTAEEIYSINHSSLKDAIIQFGGGCTGEIVSMNGLLFTNHHCGYGAIQSHSTVQHDYLTDGFWARSYAEELPNSGLTARFLNSMYDVTKEVLTGVTPQMNEQEREKRISENTKAVKEKYTKGTQLEARVGSFFNGNEFYIFLYEVFKDVRLVGAPPSAVGKFGADTDNWMWPRHTGDFSIFRVYANKNNQPAEYASDNVPYKPKHYLPISIKPKKQGDFTMIMGFPGTTDRYATSYTIDWAINEMNPTVVKIRTKKLDLMLKDMLADPAVRIKYASKYAGSSNYWKFYQGQTKGLKALKVADRKRELENQFIQWYNADNSRKQEYGEALTNIENAYKIINQYEPAVRYTVEALLRGGEIIGYARAFTPLAEEMGKEGASKANLEAMIKSLKARTEDYFKNYNLPTDKKITSAMMEMYYNDVPKHMQASVFAEIYKKYKGNFTKYTEELFAKSIFANEDKLNNFLNNPSLSVLINDPAYKLQKSISEQGKKIDAITEPANDLLARGRRLFVKGIREMQTDRKFYPDANSTMRLTYGKVGSYSPADGVEYNFVTTLDGVMAKEDPNNWEFVVPSKLKELWKTKDYGRYGENGKLVTCFLSNNDITGGNSGSPIMDADGNLIGLAFDGNWEAMSGNYAFEPDLQRTINVDARYVLFIIDKYAGAQNLINELKIIE